MELLEQFKIAWLRGTPFIAIRTPDQFATQSLILKSINGRKSPLMSWDISRGLRPVNDYGKAALEEMDLIDDNARTRTVNLFDCLSMLLDSDKLPSKSAFVLHNAHRMINEQGISQAIGNCRDIFKSKQNVLVFLAPDITFPAELQNDVFVLDEPLPSNESLSAIVKDIYRSANLDEPKPEAINKAVDALCGLAAFPAEQACAMNLKGKALDFDSLWETKRQIIRATPGLGISRGGLTFEDIGGNDNIKQFLTGVLRGNKPPRVVVFMDEVEKAFAGTGTDLSGVTTEMTGTILSEMENRQYTGAIFVGHPGAGKTAIAQAAGAEVGIPTITFDLSAMKGSLVGQSGANLRAALKVVAAVSQGEALFLATCNSLASLPPELKRRFRLGTFFFDLPTEEERELIWQMYCEKFKIGGETPPDNGWTGAEIRNCVELAWRLNTSLLKAAQYITPIIKTSPDRVKQLQEQAEGRFISSSYPGTYRKQAPVEHSTGRRIELEGE